MDVYSPINSGLRMQTGIFSVVLLFALGFVPSFSQEFGPGAAIVGFLAVLGLAGAMGAIALTGFRRDLRVPVVRGEGIVLACRRRCSAVVVSWAALFAVITGTPLLALTVDLGGPRWLSFTALLGVLIGLPTVFCLPKLSRWWALRGGYVTLSKYGLGVRPWEEEADLWAEEANLDFYSFPVPAEARWDPLWFRDVEGITTQEEQFLLTHYGDVRQDSRISFSLPDSTSRRLESRVRWIPGACEAVTRWAAEGFAPTAEEASSLGLPATWSPDRDAISLIRSRRRRRTGRDALLIIGIAMVMIAALLLVLA